MSHKARSFVLGMMIVATLGSAAAGSGGLFEDLVGTVEFQPVVSRSMDEVGVTRSCKRMMAQYTSLPFTRAESLDLDRDVTERALDGLFYMPGQEEKKIRIDPAARVTEILKTVFGSASR